ncbi:MAG: hypothetical protein IT445_02150 [Phycisphaeraceae bacterium]|nr:hypothetical protein [Phycisphaeraceae bacterium]
MPQQIELLTEIRDLLHVMAEPALAKRDEKLRNALRTVVGRSKKKAAAVVLMDGLNSQAAIVKKSKIDQGDLSRLVKALAKKSLIASNEKQPKLCITIPPNFFEQGDNSDD